MMYRLLFSFASLALCMLLTPTAHAQMGVYEEAGLGFSAGLASADQTSQKSAGIGFMLGPAFEFGGGLSIGNASDQDLTTVGATPYVAFYPVRQGEHSSVSMMIMGSYSFQSFSGEVADRWERRGLEVDGDAYALGVALFGAVEGSKRFTFIPNVGAGNAWAKASDESSAYLSVSASFMFETFTDVYLAWTPSATFADGGTTLGITMALVLGESQWQ